MTAAGGDPIALSWLVVAYQSAADLVMLLPSLAGALAGLQERGFRSELIVADNGSTDGSAALARRLVPRGVVLELGSNRGYGAALNAAARHAHGSWLACSNADLALRPADLEGLPALLASAPPDAGLLGPALRDAHGAWLPSAGGFPTLRRLLTRLPRPAAERPYLARAAHRAGPVDWVTGACLFVRAQAFAELGGFDEDFFLYYEDVDLAARARQRGWATHYAPQIAVAHLHPHAGRARTAATEARVRAGRARWFQRHRPPAEQRLLALLAGVEPLLRRARGARTPGGAGRADGLGEAGGA